MLLRYLTKTSHKSDFPHQYEIVSWSPVKTCFFRAVRDCSTSSTTNKGGLVSRIVHPTPLIELEGGKTGWTSRDAPAGYMVHI